MKPTHHTLPSSLRVAIMLGGFGLVAGCTTSVLRYTTLHVDESDGALLEAGIGTQIYGVDDRLRLARAVAPPNIVRRSADDEVFEIRSWKIEATNATQRVSTLSARDAAAPDSGPIVTIIARDDPDGGPRDFERTTMRSALRDAGHGVGYDLAVATVEGDDSEAAEAFMRAAARPDGASSQGDLRTAVDGWLAALSSDVTGFGGRTNDERAMAAAYDLALAYQLGNAQEESTVFAAMAILRAPTHALQLDVLRLLLAAPREVNATSWSNLQVGRRASTAPCPDGSAPPAPRDLRGLSRQVFASYRVRPGDAAVALEWAGRQAARLTPDGTVSAAAPTLFCAAAILYDRDTCQNAQAPSTGQGAQRCRAAVALLDSRRTCP